MEKKKTDEEGKDKDKNAAQKLDEWEQRNRIPLEYQYSKQPNGWQCALTIQNKEDVLLRTEATSKIQARLLLAKHFFEQKLDQELLKVSGVKLPVNSLREFCAKYCLPDFIIETKEVDQETLALARKTHLVATSKAAADANKREDRSETKLKLADKVFRCTLVSEGGKWIECSIGHPSWQTGITIKGAGRDTKQARRTCEVRVLLQCLQRDDMFAGLVTPETPSLKNAEDILDAKDEKTGQLMHEVVLLTSADMRDTQKATSVLSKLQPSMPLGFDCERFSVVHPTTGKSTPRLGCIQLTNGTTTVICQMSQMTEISEWPPVLQLILFSSLHRKFAVDFNSDRLHQLLPSCHGVIDLQHEAAKWPEFNNKASLAMMAARLCRLRLSKHGAVRASDWGSPTLTPAQVRYAALDAVVTLLVGLALERRAQAGAAATSVSFEDPKGVGDKDAAKKTAFVPI